VIDPPGDLPHAPAEGDAVRASFEEVALLPGPDANVAGLVGELPGRSHLHFACHGEFSWVDPTTSGLYLAGGELLNARDVATTLQLEGVRLVTLSACETGVVDSDRLPNEYVGLPGSFLQAGAPTVVSSLWSVEDESTARIMGALYERHVTDGMAPAVALRDAQLQVLADADFAHPFYWAPFLAMGA
jgi:CHAT domain-containing protein